MSASVPALTITQPWASLIVENVKHVETRSWRTAHRGLLLIHAAKGWTPDDQAFARQLGRDPDTLTRGAMLGLVRLVDCVYMGRESLDDPGFTGWRRSDLTWRLGRDERELGLYEHGRYAWLLADPYPFAEPIPFGGAQGLWYFAGDFPGRAP